MRARASALILGLLAWGCAPDATDPMAVTLYEGAYVVVMNPPVNDATMVELPAPGPTRAGVNVMNIDFEGGPTSGEGVRVVPRGGGMQGVQVGPDRLGLDGLWAVTENLDEIAVAFDGSAPRLMLRIEHPVFTAGLVTITPDTPPEEVTATLALPGNVVLFEGGRYEGDLEITGSDILVFGASEQGGRVTVTGNVALRGARSRIRGMDIGGDLLVSGEDASVSFSRVDGATRLEGSAGHLLLQNRFCGPIDVATPSRLVALGNRGMSPLPPDC